MSLLLLIFYPPFFINTVYLVCSVSSVANKQRNKNHVSRPFVANAPLWSPQSNAEKDIFAPYPRSLPRVRGTLDPALRDGKDSLLSP